MTNSALEQYENIYRATEKSSRKHIKRLTDYITALVDSGRFLEAKHFFYELCESENNHPRTIRLGYAIAIATFDIDGIRKYDHLLINSTKDMDEVYWYRFCYYHSVGKIKACEDTACELLKSKLTLDRLSEIIDACILRKNYLIAQSLAKYLSENKLKLSLRHEKLLKKIIITRLANSILRRL